MQVAMHGAGAHPPAPRHLPQAVASHHDLLDGPAGLLIEALDGLQQLLVLAITAEGGARRSQVCGGVE
jgi:hypothetical protein